MRWLDARVGGDLGAAAALQPRWQRVGEHTRAAEAAAELVAAGAWSVGHASRTLTQQLRGLPPKAAGRCALTPIPPSEKDAKLAQKLGQLQPFTAVFPQECMGQLASFRPTGHLSRPVAVCLHAVG